MKAICDECGKEFDIRSSEYRKNQHHYCSVDCRCKVLRKTFIDNFNARVGNKYTLIEYKDKDNVTVKCKVCGGIFTRYSSSVVRMDCPCCREYRARLKRLNADMVRTTRKLLKQRQKALDAMAERLHKAVEKSKRKAMADQHRKEKRRETDKIKELKRERRIKNNGAVDKDITLDKLFIRDNGVCSLCGGRCNYTDSIVNEKGHFIVGDTYPSIDHILPLSKGGTHTWDNVQLAHFRCNTMKGNRTTAPMQEAI